MITLIVLGPPPTTVLLPQPTATLPPPPTAVLRHNDVRPCTCIIKPSRHPSALGYMTIRNNTDTDAVVCLTHDGAKDTLIAGTIRAGEALTLTGISGGLYSLYYGFGKDWDYSSNAFRRQRQYYQDREPFDYTRPYQRNWAVTLYTTPGLPNADEISESEFPNIERSVDATPTPWGSSASGGSGSDSLWARVGTRWLPSAAVALAQRRAPTTRAVRAMPPAATDHGDEDNGDMAAQAAQGILHLPSSASIVRVDHIIPTGERGRQWQ